MAGVSDYIGDMLDTIRGKKYKDKPAGSKTTTALDAHKRYQDYLDNGGDLSYSDWLKQQQGGEDK